MVATSFAACGRTRSLTRIHDATLRVATVEPEGDRSTSCADTPHTAPAATRRVRRDRPEGERSTADARRARAHAATSVGALFGAFVFEALHGAESRTRGRRAAATANACLLGVRGPGRSARCSTCPRSRTMEPEHDRVCREGTSSWLVANTRPHALDRGSRLRHGCR